jgi:hypothetical protein
MIMRTSAFRISGVAFFLMTFALSLNGQKGQPFKSGCATLPFESIKNQNLAIDQQCGTSGTAKKFSTSAKQNEAKNNFCAQGTPVALTFADFDQLQTLARKKHIPFGGKKLPTDRKALRNILTLANGTKVGEGDVVTLEGFVFGAQHSNTKLFSFNGEPGDGEGVNCNSGELDMNDIHIQLVESKKLLQQGDECATVTAEISPHFRPASWDRFDVNPITKDKGPKPSLPLAGAKVRLTGPLFFDASHSPCENGHGSSPARRSIWEIHPVYAIDVFNAAKGKFVPLDEWAQSH